jgi:hypothetical protein
MRKIRLKRNKQGKKVQSGYGESTLRELKSIGLNILSSVLTLKVCGCAQIFSKTTLRDM